MTFVLKYTDEKNRPIFPDKKSLGFGVMLDY